MGRTAHVLTFTLLLAACGDRIADQAAEPALAPTAVFEGLPLSGNLATAVAAGFGNCLDDGRGVRCFREDVRIMGVGPVRAAVDLIGAPARFDHVTLWHPTDQSAMLPLRDVLARDGWGTCLTPDEERFWKAPSPLRLALDTNYWGKRRLVIRSDAAGKAYCP
ncbi:hypothetical protein [Rhizorhabdus dicambivorans]|uniref:Lipoprotein n=1 Tax=Rhizorhabdus dicambivorans TaxID=1850238 RepID=A0A2A4FU74_9SPHN|nr:hypothetical protein [Rhizorhabdus dicambivorans]PCE41280.1 hypothetical protein COO09_15565 [Rhizorhabdus dicambivorans]